MMYYLCPGLIRFFETPACVLGPDAVCTPRFKPARAGRLRAPKGADCGHSRPRLEDRIRMRALIGEIQNGCSHAHVGHSARAQVNEGVELGHPQRSVVTAQS